MVDRKDFLAAVNMKVRREAEGVLERFCCADALDMVNGGKRLRALLVYSLTENVSEKTVLAASAIELLHASTLVHDDIIDDATTRRGQPTISSAHSIGTAIMVGNAIFSRAVELARLSMSAELQTEFHELYVQIAAAQNDELLWRGRLRPESVYHEICDGKTGLLFRFCVRVSGGDRLYEEIVSRIAYAFQIVDDIDDILAWRGESSAHASKLADYDIGLGNITLPAILALYGKGISSDDFTMGEIEELDDGDWRYGINESRARVTKLASESRSLISKLTRGEAAERFTAWAEPMMQQLEAKAARIDAIKLS